MALLIGSVAISAIWATRAEAAPLSYGELSSTGDTRKGLLIQAYETGNFGVFMDYQPQFFGGPSQTADKRGLSNGSDWFVNGTDYYTGYFKATASSLTGTVEGTLKTANVTMTKPTSDTLHWVWEQNSLIFEQTLTVKPGSSTLERTWSITNKTGSTITGSKLFSGGDTFFAGSDRGYAGHSDPLDMTYVYRDATAGLMAFRGGEDTAVDGYFGGYFDYGLCHVTGKAVYTNCANLGLNAHQMPNTVSGAVTDKDQGVFTQWNMPDIAPDGSYTVAGEITFETAGQLFVMGESLKSVQPNQTLTKQFVLVNVGSAAVEATLTAQSSEGWTAQVAGPVTVPPNGGDGVLVPVQLTVPATAVHGDEDTLTLTATYTPTGSSSTTTRTGMAKTRVYDPVITISAHNGTYDGRGHDAISSMMLDGVEVLTDLARMKEYSIDDGNTWLPDMPSVTGVGSYPVKVKIAGDGLPTIEAAATAIVEPKELAVTVANTTVNAGETPSYALSYGGFEAEETAATAAGFTAPTVMSSYDPTNPLVAAYDLALSGGGADNYVFVLGDQRLTVSPAVDVVGDGRLTGVAGRTELHTFTLTNASSLDREVSLSVGADHYAVVLPGAATVTIPARSSVDVLVHEAVPSTAVVGTVDTIELVVAYTIGTSGFDPSATAETEVGPPPRLELVKRGWIGLGGAPTPLTYEGVLAHGTEVLPSSMLPTGTTVWWTYLVQNAGPYVVDSMVVTDSPEGVVCEVASLAPGQWQGCVKSGTVG